MAVDTDRESSYLALIDEESGRVAQITATEGLDMLFAARFHGAEERRAAARRAERATAPRPIRLEDVYGRDEADVP